MKKISSENKGFTLVEMTVVLIIIGFIVGGILVGRNLVENANLNTFVGQIEGFKSSILKFQEQYNALPGDYRTAYTTWGADCATSASFCNGDGDSIIENSETYLAWKHLDLSKLISETLDKPAGVATTCKTGVNLPVTAYEAANTVFDYNVNDALSLSAPAPGQLIAVGINDAALSSCGLEGQFSSEQLYLMDKKIDDGFPYSGHVLNSENKVASWVPGTPKCCTSSTGNGNDDADYAFNNTGTCKCRLFYKLKVE